MNRDALVVGINQYPFLKDTPTSKAKHLNTPASDAEAIALRLEEYGGFRVRRLPESIQEEQRRVDPKKLVQGDVLYEAIIQLFNPAGDSIPQTALLYFAGHGLRRNLGGVTEGFLATSDSDPRKNQWGVSLRWLRELLQRSPVQQQIVWLDCCYSGELLNFAEADLGTATQGRTRFFIAAAREFEPAEENIQGQHGVFSQVLWEGLDPRRQPEGVVNNDRLIEHIDQTLKGTPQQPIWYNPNCEILLTGEREEVFVSIPDGVCPYKGLRFFDVEDAPYFYGREALTQKLIERVQVGKGNFLAVLGVSGSGKSSVLRAGLIYQLQQERRLPGTEQWKIRIFTPGEQPLVSLATAFLDEEVTDIERARQLKAAEDAIAQGATGLARLIRASKSPRTVLIVDQFEEVFTVCQSQTERQQFITSLLDALKQTGDKLCLIFAMRDDFLGKCAAYQEMADLIQANLVMVTPMNAQELRQAIVEPAKKLGRKVEENLIDAILKDLGVEVEQHTREPEPGMLPLLSYTLEQLWQRQTLNWLKLDSYNKLGGVQKTLENLADQVYKSLESEEQQVAKQIFLKLTQLGEGTPDTRKQVRQQDLVTSKQSEALMNEVLKKLVQAKLIVTSERRQGQEKVAVVDVAHEVLIRNWSVLRRWVNEDRNALIRKQSIEDAAENWRDQGKYEDDLLQGLRVSDAQDYQQKYAYRFPLSSLAQEFVEQSSIAVKIRLLVDSSKALFTSDRKLEALIKALWAGINLKQAVGVNFNTRIRVVTALHQAVYGVRERNRLQGHSDSVYGLSFSPDGKMIASASEDTTVKLWSLGGKELHTFKGHRDSVYGLSFSPDGKMIASASGDGTVKLWSLNGRKLQTFKGHRGVVASVSFSPSGKMIASASSGDGTVKLWSLQGIELQTFRHGDKTDCFAYMGAELQLATYRSSAISLCFSPSGETLAYASSLGTVKLWGFNGREIQTLQLSEDEWQSFGGVSLSPDVQALASVHADGTITVWSLDGRELQTFRGSYIITIAFSPNGQIIASGNAEGIIKVWSLDGRELQTFNHGGSLLSITFSPDNQTIASASINGIIKLWSLYSREQEQVFRRDDGGVNSVSFSPDGKTITSAGHDNTVKLWSLNGRELQTFRHDESVNSVSFSPDGQMITSASWDCTVKLWSLDGRELQTFRHDEKIESVCFSPDGQMIASASRDGTVKLWSLDGRQLHTFQNDYVQDVSFSPNGQTIAFASWDRTVKLWSLDGRQLQTLIGHTGKVESVCFSPNSQMIASASADGTIKLWSLDGTQLQTFIGHTNIVHSVCFSPNNQMIASASEDGTVKLWSLDGRELQTFRQGSPVNGVCFSPNSQIIASGSNDGKVILWNLTLDDLLVRGYNWVRDYLKTNPNLSERDRRLCDEIEPLAPFLVEQGKDLAREGDIKEAVTKFQKALELEPNLNLDPEAQARQIAAPAQVEKGEKLVREGKVKEAIAAYSEAQKLDPTVEIPADSWSELCWIGCLQGHAADIMDVCNKAVELEPENGMFRDVRGLAKALINDLEGAIEDFQAFIDWTNNAQLSADIDKNDLTNASLQRQSWIDALRIGKNSVAALVLVNRGQGLIEQGEVKEAIAAYTEAQKLDPTLEIPADSWCELCRIGCSQGQAADVMDACNKAVELEPENGMFWDMRGVAKALINDLEGAIEDFQTFINLTNNIQLPSNILHQLITFGKRIVRLLGNRNRQQRSADQPLPNESKEELMNLKLIRQSWIDALRIGKNSVAALVLVNRGQGLIEQGEVKEAIAAYIEAQKLDPTLEISADSWCELCWIGYLQGQAADVMDACNKAVELEPENESFRLNRGLARALIGDKDGAIEDLQLFIDWTDDDAVKSFFQSKIIAFQAGEDLLTTDEIEWLLGQ